MKITFRNADLALHPFDRALAASLGNRQAKRLRRHLVLALRLEGLDLSGSPALQRGAGVIFDALCARLLDAS